MSAVNPRWVWLDPAVVRAAHGEQLAEHGGPTGVRDANLLTFALGRPQQLANYGSPDAADLAAAYAFALARNKRTAFVALELFLFLNGFELTASDADCVLTTLELAAGKLEEAALAQWIRTHLQAL